MNNKDYRRPPEAIDMAAEERAIRRDTSIALVLTVAAFLAAFRFLPAAVELPEDRADALGFAALAWAVPAFVLMVAILMVSTGRRFSAADIGGQAAGPPSEKLAVKSAFLQNTLEQTVLAAAFFVIGRALFYLGYERGAQGRSLGMSLTMLPAFVGYLLVAWLFLFGA
ncbi:MAG: hypothetical protein ACXIVF_01115 [Rhizobiaceae bacterium]